MEKRDLGDPTERKTQKLHMEMIRNSILSPWMQLYIVGVVVTQYFLFSPKTNIF